MNNIEPGDVDKNNMSISINMGCHRIVFLNAFVTSVMVNLKVMILFTSIYSKSSNFYSSIQQNFLNNFQAAQQAIAEASAAAAEAAKTNIKDVHERATRIELSVKLKAPVIYVPMNSKSEHCLMLDMGNLTVSNVLRKLEVETDSGDYPVVDEMNVELQNLKLSRCALYSFLPFFRRVWTHSGNSETVWILSCQIFLEFQRHYLFITLLKISLTHNYYQKIPLYIFY